MALVPFPGTQSAALQIPPDDEPDSDAGKMSFLDHLDELRKRLIRSCLGVIVGVLSALWYHGQIFDFIFAPTRATLRQGQTLIYNEPGEAFTIHITVALIAGVVIAAPYVMYQVWMFIAPGLYSKEKKLAIPFVALSSLGFIGGALFNHYVAFRFMMAFFGGFADETLTYQPRIEPIFSLYTKFLIAMGLVFQMPTIVLFLAKMKLVTARFLAKNIRYAILIIFILAAVITPSGDPGTQTVFAAPMIGLYLLSIVIAWLVGPKRMRSSDESFLRNPGN